MQRKGSHYFWWGILPLLSVLVSYGFTLNGHFLSDDFQLLESASHSADLIEASSMRYGGGADWVRPVVHWSFWLQWLSSGADPFAFRCFNLLVHGLNAVLVAWLAGVWIGSRSAGTIAGLCFAFLPIHPESATWISGRSDLLSTFGVLITLWAWTRACAAGGRSRHAVLAGLGLLFALCSKESSVVAVPLLAVVSVAFYRDSVRRQWPALLVLALLTVGYFIMRAQLLGGLGGLAASDGSSVQLHFEAAGALHFMVKAVWLLVAPAHLVYREHGLPWISLVPLAAWVLLVACSLFSGERRRIWSTGLALTAMLILALLPVAGWARVDEQFESTRYLYLSSVFSCIGLGLLATRVNPEPARRWKSASLAIPVLVILGAFLFQQRRVNGFWVEAGVQSRSVLESLPEFDVRSPLVVTGLPDSVQGAYIFRNAFPHGVRLFVEPRANVRSVDPAEFDRLQEIQARSGESATTFLSWYPFEGWIAR